MREEEEEDKADSGVEDVVDPRVKGELDALNQSTTEINDLETKLLVERSKFKSLLSDATKELTDLSKKYGKAIERARPYYDANKEAKQAQTALLRAVQNFQNSNGVHRAAKETISLAELKLEEIGDQKVSSAWQEMMNLQTIRFMEAEANRTKSERLHAQATKRYDFLKKKAEKIRLKHKRSTSTTRHYFETKEKFEVGLQEQRQRVVTIQQSINAAKGRYREALENLEKISSEIHQKRQLDAHLRKLLEPRDDVIDGSEDDDVTSIGFDLSSPKTYDEVDELEKELNDFHQDEDWRSEEEEEEQSDSSSVTSSSASSSGRRHSSRSSRHFRRQISDLSLDDETIAPPTNHNREKTKINLNPPIRESDDETIEVFAASSQSTNQNTGRLSRDKTYDNLHGTSHVIEESVNGKIELNEGYDIFDDLC